jgi:hypothetical protein
MSDTRQIATAIEHAPVARDQHTHNFTDVYRELSELKTHDGGANSAQFRRDLTQLNSQLHADGVLPNLQITGVDSANHIMTRNISGGHDVAQNSSAVNDFGGAHDRQAQEHQPPDRQSPEQMLAQLFGIKVSPNGDLSSPADQPSQVAAGGVMGAIMNGLFGGSGAGNDSSAGQPQLAWLGLNPLMQQSLQGWGDTPPDDSSSA